MVIDGKRPATIASWLALTCLAATAVAAPAPESWEQGGSAAEGEAGEPVDEPGFFGEYFPFFPDADLVEPVDENKVFIYLLNLLPFGGLWGPLVALPEEGRPPFGGDVIVPYLVPMFAGVGSVFCLFTPTLVVGLVAGIVLGGVVGTAIPPCAACSGCGVCPSLACLVLPFGLQYWIAPTASINAWSRAYKKAASSSELVPKPAPDAVPEPKQKAPAEKKPGEDDGWVPY